MARIAFALELLLERLRGQSRTCPYCSTADTKLLGRKYILLEALRCQNCGLIFRFPKPSSSRLETYYQEAYDGGAVTDMPDDEVLTKRLQTGFTGDGAGNNYAAWIVQVQQFKTNGRVFEFGCSWGYGLYQLQLAGYDSEGFEISRSRANYGRQKLGLKIYTDIKELAALNGRFDVVLTAHVLEHLPDLKASLATMRDLLRPGGMLFAFAPNGGGDAARTQGLKWGPFLSEDHVSALDAPFLTRAFGDAGLSVIGCATSPYSEPARPYGETSLAGEELMVVAAT